MPFEKHRILLVDLFDTLIKLFDDDADFASFHLDGQTIVLEDYLHIRPEMRATLERLVREGKLIIGPWYVLQDEWLTSGEANIRNLLVGHAVAKEFGNVCKVGYFPDSFGNMGQAPQILEQAGIDNAVFGRGVKPVGSDNKVMGSYESVYSEMVWQAPNGSEVLGILFANWYNNGMEIPVDKQTAHSWWQARLANIERFASTPHLLLMNGCDHQPVQTNLSEALRVARELFPDVDFIHSNFPDYINAVKSCQVRANTAETANAMATIVGELRSQQTDGWWTLANTASARVYLKQANQRCQALLEKGAEPLAAIASRLGIAHPGHLLTHSWKTLMQNHPHDSICGCSSDEVHREMMTRFAKSRSVAESVVEDSLKAIAAHIDTADMPAPGIPFVVFNTSGRERTGTVTVCPDVRRVYAGGDKEILNGVQIDSCSLVDARGNRIPALMEDMGIAFGYDLPKDGFRRPYWARRVRVTFSAESVPAMGYRAYELVEPRADDVERRAEEGDASDGSIKGVGVIASGQGRKGMENEFLSVTINPDGTIDVRDKRNGREYSGLGLYEDTGDIGNEYIYMQPKGDEGLTTRGHQARISLRECNKIRCSYEISDKLDIPLYAEGLSDEIERMVPFINRKAQRSSTVVPMEVVTTVTLEAGVPAVMVCVTLENKAKDHRFRVLFPTGITARQHRVDSVFEVAIRDNRPSKEWINPSNCQHQQAFVNLSDAEGGLTIASKGLNEYEILPSRSDMLQSQPQPQPKSQTHVEGEGEGESATQTQTENTIAVTLLRCVGEIGDWGVFPTPEAQCLGSHTFEYAIIPHLGGDGMAESFAYAYQFQFPMLSVQTDEHRGCLPTEHTFVKVLGTGLELTALKKAEASDNLIIRCFNTAAEPTSLRVDISSHLHPSPNGQYLSDVLESAPEDALEEGASSSDGEGAGDDDGEGCSFVVKPAGIITVGVR